MRHDRYARRRRRRHQPGAQLHPGQWVSLHWEWVCDRLTERQVATLRHYTLHHLAVVNDRVEHPGAVLALD